MNLLLTSNFPMKKNDLIVQRIEKLGKNLKILYTAYTDNSKKYCSKVGEYGLSNPDFVNISKDINRDSLDTYDVIMLHGGNPFNIKKTLKKSGLTEFLFTAKPLIITTSGSSLVISKDFAIFNMLYPKMKINDSKGLNLFPHEVIPHFERYKKKESIIKNYSIGKKVYAITDGAAIAYNGKTIELIGDVKLIQ